MTIRVLWFLLKLKHNVLSSHSALIGRSLKSNQSMTQDVNNTRWVTVTWKAQAYFLYSKEKEGLIKLINKWKYTIYILNLLSKAQQPEGSQSGRSCWRVVKAVGSLVGSWAMEARTEEDLTSGRNQEHWGIASSDPGYLRMLRGDRSNPENKVHARAALLLWSGL